MRQTLFVLSLVFMFSGLSFAQTKTITNADLEKFRQKRLQAKKDLRENYRELGFSSPEEMKRRNEASEKQLSELSQKLRLERLAREENRNPGNSETGYSDSDIEQPGFIDYQQFYGASYYYSNRNRNRFFRTNRRFRNNRFRRGNRGTGFRGIFRIGSKDRRKKTFGSSRRLTRQNRAKSRRSDISRFGFGVTAGGSVN